MKRDRLRRRALRFGGASFLSQRVLEFERRVLVRILRKVGGRVTTAAALAGRNRTQFYRLLEWHELKPKDFRS